jgi:pyrroline-5-carboxylate reductase
LCREIHDVIAEKRPLVISIAAGIPCSVLTKLLGENIPIVRTMPNTPASINCGATGLFATKLVTEEQKNLSEALLRAVGLIAWVSEESHLDIVTALSGSGPAYYFLLMEAMEKAATQLGLPQHTARILTLQTAFGAAKMALESDEDAATLRRRVTSPGGTTEQAIKTFEQGHFMDVVASAISAANTRSIELARQFGGEK